MWRVACVRFCTYDVLPARGRGQGAGPAVGRALRSVTVRVAQSTVLGGVHLSSPSSVIRVIRVTLVVVLYRELDGSGVRPYVVSTRYCRQSVKLKGRTVYLPDTVQVTVPDAAARANVADDSAGRILKGGRAFLHSTAYHL